MTTIKSYLIIEKGPLEEKVFPLEARGSIGRGKENHICLSHSTVSKQHAVYYEEDGNTTDFSPPPEKNTPKQPTKPVSGNVVITSGNKSPANMDVKKIEEAVKEKLSAQEKTEPNNNTTLAQSFKKNNIAEERISDVQIGALNSLIKSRGVSKTTLMREVFNDPNKEIETLTRKEAIKATHYLNPAKTGR